MLKRFVMNGQLWKVKTVNANDDILIDRTGIRTVAVTDPNTFYVYISDDLSGDFLTTVTLHELAHVSMFAWDILPYLHSLVPKKNWIEVEELIANLIADRAKEIFERAYEIVGDKAIEFVPYGMERLVS